MLLILVIPVVILKQLAPVADARMNARDCQHALERGERTGASYLRTDEKIMQAMRSFAPLD